jgi:hypothetical protein
MLESKLQRSCIAYAKHNGWFVLKVIKCNVNGYPDCTLFKDGKTIFIEFKSLIGKQSELQRYVQKQLEQQAFEYHVVKNLEDFRKIITIM